MWLLWSPAMTDAAEAEAVAKEEERREWQGEGGGVNTSMIIKDNKLVVNINSKAIISLANYLIKFDNDRMQK